MARAYATNAGTMLSPCRRQTLVSARIPVRPRFSRMPRPGRNRRSDAPTPERLSGYSGEIEPVQVHHLGPGCNEVMHKGFLGVVTGKNFRERPKLRVRTE